MIEIGKYHDLEVIKKLDFGMYLDCEGEEILLPRSYIPENTEPGDILLVFLYRDSEDRIIATTLKPFAIVGDFAVLSVKSVNSTGAFLDWGLPKDLLVPFREQKEKMVEGKKYLVKIYIDTTTDRIAASCNLSRFLSKDISSLEDGMEVDLIIGYKTELGFNVIINSEFSGLLYKNEIFKRIKTGDKTKGWVKKLREDGKVDVSLQPLGYDSIDSVSSDILRKLNSNNGVLRLGDKSDPTEIYNVLQISKKVFKKAVGLLYRHKKITVEDYEIKISLARDKK